MIWCIKTYAIAYVKIQKNEDILSIMSNLQPNCCLKVYFQKVDQHAGGKWLIQDTKRRKDNQLQSLKLPAEYPSWVARCDIKGSDGTMLNPIFWKKVQGQIGGIQESKTTKIGTQNLPVYKNTNLLSSSGPEIVQFSMRMIEILRIFYEKSNNY